MEESRISQRVCRQRWMHTRDDRGHGEGKGGQWTSIERWGKNPKCSFVRRFLWRQKVRSCIAATPPQTADVRWLVWFCRRETKARRRFSFPLPFSLPRLALARWIRNKAIGKAGESEEMGGYGKKREGNGNCKSLNHSLHWSKEFIFNRSN